MVMKKAVKKAVGVAAGAGLGYLVMGELIYEAVLNIKVNDVINKLGDARLDEHGKDIYRAVGEVVVGELGGGHIIEVARAAEERPCGRLSLLGLLLAVDELCKLICKDLLGGVELAALP